MSNPSIESIPTPAIASPPPSAPIKAEKILCPHCKRTASNGIKCKGACVEDAS